MSEMRVPLLDLKAQYSTIREEVRAAMDRVLDSQHFIQGPEVEAFEQEAAAYAKCRHAIGVSSGTDAILLSLMALRIGPGDEVITTPHTFIATAGSIVRLGARPVFVDIDPTTFNIDPTGIEARITARTKAIMPVHLFGQMADMRQIAEVGRRRGVHIIEDGAQAIGCHLDGAAVGELGDLATFSFFPSKNLGAYGDGGMVICNDENLAARTRLLRNQGQSPKYFSVEVSGNFRLDALQAAVLRAKLPHLDEWTLARQRNAGKYRELFAQAGLSSTTGAGEVVLPSELPRARHIYNQFVIRTKHRDAIRHFLAARGIATEIYYPQPMHLQACFRSLDYKAGDFPKSEQAAAESLALPIYPELTPTMMTIVVDEVAQFFRRGALAT